MNLNLSDPVKNFLELELELELKKYKELPLPLLLLLIQLYLKNNDPTLKIDPYSLLKIYLNTGNYYIAVFDLTSVYMKVTAHKEFDIHDKEITSRIIYLVENIYKDSVPKEYIIPYLFSKPKSFLKSTNLKLKDKHYLTKSTNYDTITLDCHRLKYTYPPYRIKNAMCHYIKELEFEYTSIDLNVEKRILLTDYYSNSVYIP